MYNHFQGNSPMFLLSMLLVVLCPGILMSQGRIDVDNASIEVFPKTVTVQVGEQWRDHKAYVFAPVLLMLSQFPSVVSAGKATPWAR